MAFSSCRTFRVSPDYIPAIADDLQHDLRNEEFEVSHEELLGGNAVVSITKGGFFKAVVGMKTSLRITLTGMGDRIKVSADVGIFGQQAIPAVISMLFFWPVIITQIWGLVKQSQLDDHVMELVDRSIDRHAARTVQAQQGDSASVFCPNCGAHAKGVFCSACGTRL